MYSIYYITNLTGTSFPSLSSNTPWNKNASGQLIHELLKVP